MSKKLPKAEYDAACEFKQGVEGKQSKVLSMAGIAGGVILVATIVVCVVLPGYLLAGIGGGVALALLFGGITWYRLRGCPACGRLYSRKDLELCHTETGSYQKASPSGGVFSVEFTNSIYRTRCNRCEGDIWVWKWKRGHG